MVWGLTIAVRSREGTCIGIISSRVMETEAMLGLTLSKFQITAHGLGLGMGTESIDITASQQGRRCRIGIDTNTEDVDENDRARCSSMSSICQFNVM